MEDYLTVGKIVNTQGIKGEVRVISKTDFAKERYQKGQTLFLFQKNQAKPIPLVVDSHRQHKSFDIVRFKDHPSINDVEKYRDGVLKIAQSDLHALSDHEFYYYEIIGATVWDEHNEKLGEISEILAPGANDVWVVKRENKKDVLLPYIESVVKHVDVQNKEVFVEVPEGLIDDED